MNAETLEFLKLLARLIKDFVATKLSTCENILKMAFQFIPLTKSEILAIRFGIAPLDIKLTIALCITSTPLLAPSATPLIPFNIPEKSIPKI